MDWLLAAVIGGLTFLLGEVVGWRAGRDFGRDAEIVRRRIAELPRPWDK